MFYLPIKISQANLAGLLNQNDTCFSLVINHQLTIKSFKPCYPEGPNIALIEKKPIHHASDLQ